MTGFIGDIKLPVLLDLDPHASLFLWQDAQSLHGDIPQKQREITLKGFRNGDFGVMVATNVAARGLDIPEVDLVIQSSPPKVSVYIFILLFLLY